MAGPHHAGGNPRSLGLLADARIPSIDVMNTNYLTSNDRTSHARAGNGPHYLMLGSVAVSRLLGGAETGNTLSLVELIGAPGSGPGPHLDPWQESFYVLDGELTFRVEEDGVVRTVVARHGDAVSIPEGVGHAFTVTSAAPARYLIASTPAGIDAFFADAGDAVAQPSLPIAPPPFDRERLRAAFAKHRITPYSFPTESAESGSCAG
jgi:quercetin dioxygenase-like cupin family protein